MSTETPELDAFYRFAQRLLAQEGSEANLEDVLRAFRQQEDWAPRTPLGRRLKELRHQFIAEGGVLLSADEVSAEVSERRGRHFAGE